MQVTPHNLRSTGHPSPYSKPFKPGVATTLDILLSLRDQAYLSVVTSVFYTQFGGNYIDSYYVVELGFPDTGAAHASGRQGFVYYTGNRSQGALPNFAVESFHMTSDISVVHAPDYSSWSWLDFLGFSYYEGGFPGAIEPPAKSSTWILSGSAAGSLDSEQDRRAALETSVREDFNALSRGFNLHRPLLDPAGGRLAVSFRLFGKQSANLSLYNLKGRKLATLFERPGGDPGPHSFVWDANGLDPGTYSLTMRYGDAGYQSRNLCYRP